jgi:hypothetical protein
MKFTLFFIRLPVILLLLWGGNACSGRNNNDTNANMNNQPRLSKKMLTAAILFKTAVQIQEKYLQDKGDPFRDDQSRLYRFLGRLALAKKNITAGQDGKPLFAQGTPYAQCVENILASDRSHWTIKRILADYRAPDLEKSESDVLFNPYIFLPEPLDLDTLGASLDFDSLWDLYYTALLLDESQMLGKIYPHLLKRTLEEFPDDRQLFENLQRMYHQTDGAAAYEARSLSLFYLITGNTAGTLDLSADENRVLREKVEYYDTHYYREAYITVNDFTRDNKYYMWLAARQQEQAGNINKTNVFIRTTFDNDVLRNIQKFPPNRQVYFYTTIRIALNMNSPEMYRFVYGALDPLTKFLETPYKEYLKMQILQLID